MTKPKSERKKTVPKEIVPPSPERRARTWNRQNMIGTRVRVNCYGKVLYSSIRTKSPAKVFWNNKVVIELEGVHGLFPLDDVASHEELRLRAESRERKRIEAEEKRIQAEEAAAEALIVA